MTEPAPVVLAPHDVKALRDLLAQIDTAPGPETHRQACLQLAGYIEAALDRDNDRG